MAEETIESIVIGLQGVVAGLQGVVAGLQEIVLDLSARVKRLEARPVCIEMPRLDKALTEAVRAQAAKAKEN